MTTVGAQLSVTGGKRERERERKRERRGEEITHNQESIHLVHERGGINVLDEVDGARVDGLHGGDGEEVGGEAGDEGRLLEGRLSLGKRGVDVHELIEVLLELGVVGVDDLGEDLRGGLVGLVNDVHVELGGVQTDGLVELGAGVVVEVHGDVHREAEEASPQLSLPVVDELGASLENGGEEVTVTVLILAPVLEVLEDGVKLVIGVRLKVAVDGDVTPVADLLGQVGGVDDELGLEEGVLLPSSKRRKELGTREKRRGWGGRCESFVRLFG